ncbi:MAG TPA: sugar phosphate isomerase/epimerase [Opitutaceae bacterium]|nr:sugar phosphate isomerase/epimerase [Opitutaceae bacterium]
MNLSQVAAQLYTVRDHCRSALELAVTARKIRAIGYPAVQLSGLGPIDDREIVAIMRGEGLAICATHEPAADILERPEKVIDRLQRLGCRLTAYPYPQGVDLADPVQVDRLIRQLDAAGARLRAAGCMLGYHHHALEFASLDGTLILDRILAGARPENLVAELDVYWVRCGGGDPVDWCRRLRGRLPFIHLKDHHLAADNRPEPCELGAGSLPFREIVAAAEAAGCEWFIVEQDTCPGDPFDSLKISFDYLAAELIA